MKPRILPTQIAALFLCLALAIPPPAMRPSATSQVAEGSATRRAVAQPDGLAFPPVVGVRLPWSAEEEKDCGGPALRPTSENDRLKGQIAAGLEETPAVQLLETSVLGGQLTVRTRPEGFWDEIPKDPSRVTGVATFVESPLLPEPWGPFVHPREQTEPGDQFWRKSVARHQAVVKILQSGTSADLQRHLPAILQIFEPAGLEENLTVGQARERVNQYINGGSNFLRYRQDNFSDDPTVLGRKTGLDNEETKLEAIRNVARDDLLRVELAGNGIWLLPPAIQPWPEDKKVVLRSAYELKEVRPLEELLLMDNNLPLVLRTGRPFFAWVRGQKGVKAVGFYRLNSEPYNARFLYYVPVSEFRNDPVAAARYLLRALHAIDPSVYRARKIELRRGALWAPGVLGDALLIRPTAAGLETTVEAEALRMEKQFILGKRLNPAEVLRVLRAYYEEVFGSAVGGKKVWGQGAFEAFLRESADQYKDPNELWKKVFLRVKRAEAEKSEEAVRRIFEESFKVGNQRWTDTGVIAVIQLADEKNRQQGKRIYHLYAGDLKKNRRGRISNALRGAWAAVGYHRVRGLSSWADALRRADVDPGADYKKAAGLEGPKEKLADLLDQAIPAVKAMIDSRKKLALFIDPELVDPSWVSKGASFELESAAKQLGKLTAYPYLQIDILPDRPGELDRRRKELEAAGYELLIIRADWPGAWLGTPFSDVVYVRPGQPIPLAMLEAVLFDLLGQWWRQTSQLNGKPLASPILFDAAPYHGVRGLNVEDVRQLIGDRFSV